MANRTYIAGNPRQIPDGIRVLVLGEREVFPGDVVRSSELDEVTEQNYVSRGFLRLAKRGEGLNG
jgi:hypothetical protein